MSKSIEKPTTGTNDGRLQRSERSREAIIDAIYALICDGNLVPTAQQVSDRANVGIRTVFRHFSDMETLFACLDMQLRDTYEALFIGGDREGSVAKRLQHAIEQHALGYEQQKMLTLSVQAMMWQSEVLRKNNARNQRGLRKDLDDWLPELRELDKGRREAIDAVASFETWHRLRETQGLSKKVSIAVLVDTISALMGL